MQRSRLPQPSGEPPRQRVLKSEFKGEHMRMETLLSRVACAAVTMVAAGAWAQAYPTKPVRVIVPYAAGGPADVYSRFLGDRLEKSLGRPFLIEDRPGGSAIIGTDAVAKSAPDGYTLLAMSNTHTVNESLFSKKPYVLLRDLAPVSPLNYSDLLLVVNPAVPAKNLKELIALAKAKPGALNYASSGSGTPYHMAGELFKAMAGVDIVHVPHKGSDQARTSVMSGDVQMMFDAVTTMAQLARAGKVRAIATSGRTRSAITPEIPTVSEAGVPGYESTIWLGIMAPAATPKPVVDKLNSEIRKVMSQPDVIAIWAKQGAVPMHMSPDEFRRFMEQDIQKWAKVVKISGAKVE
jgi:tripartite-type tricarboxylate transporter receptor subunit TctC